MKENSCDGDTYNSMQVEVAGFCLTAFFWAILWTAGYQLFQDGSLVAILWGIVCWGSGSFCALLTAHCGHSIYKEISVNLKRFFAR